MIVVCCQVAVFATGRLLVQSCPTKCSIKTSNLNMACNFLFYFSFPLICFDTSFHPCLSVLLFSFLQFISWTQITSQQNTGLCMVTDLRYVGTALMLTHKIAVYISYQILSDIYMSLQQLCKHDFRFAQTIRRSAPRKYQQEDS